MAVKDFGSHQKSKNLITFSKLRHRMGRIPESGIFELFPCWLRNSLDPGPRLTSNIWRVRESTVLLGIKLGLVRNCAVLSK
jgi:hypothetical protein